MKHIPYGILLICLFLQSYAANSQERIRGRVSDGEGPLVGASVAISESSKGTQTDYNGDFELRVNRDFPLTLVVTYLGYQTQEVEVTSSASKLDLRLVPNAILAEVIEVRGQRISEKQKAAPLMVESMDLQGIRETAADNFYDGLGALKGVDLTSASLGFKIINTRGFNSTSPVRSLQLIDGVDNQSPGLNFSLGNFLGASELDIVKADIIQGASSAYYGPGAFNGVISMETKNPFIHQGLSAIIKVGERALFNPVLRWADVRKNKRGEESFAYKINLSYFRANDWEATNDAPVDGSRSAAGNPGGWDRVNTYGDEYIARNDYSSDLSNLFSSTAGLRLFHRTGYREVDLVDYDTRNLKANLALHFRTNPSAKHDSPELIFSSSFSYGTTIYQGDNRFSLKDILFFQNRLEFRKKDKFFIRAYATNEDAGNSYDPYFTALRLQNRARSNSSWGAAYVDYWQENIYPQMVALEYPVLQSNNGMITFDFPAAQQWLTDNADLVTSWHQEAENFANLRNPTQSETMDRFEPGTERFKEAFDDIRSRKNNEGGTLFFDKSALYHVHGEYLFEFPFLEELRVGANFRQYRPNSEGTIFKDTSGVRIINNEFGAYLGMTKKFTRKWALSATIRVDKNENFNFIYSPAASLVYSPDPLNYLRFSFSSGVRNPTLADQYLNLDVGPAKLLGNLDGFYNIVSLESLLAYINDLSRPAMDTLQIDPIQPERVQTFEAGYRTTLFDRLYLDGSYFINRYEDFIGYRLGAEAEIVSGFVRSAEVFRIAANSENIVTTQGFALGAHLYVGDYYRISGNYSFNKLLKTFSDDPIIPAFNTPEHKFNLGFSGRGIPLAPLSFIRSVGFSVNYKWVEGFLFDGSPQFTGFINSYGLLDAQVSFELPAVNGTLKIGASNVLNNEVNQTYGGPAIGRLAYVSFWYDFKK